MGLNPQIEPPRPPQSFGAEILDLRHFNSHHLRPLLERESQMWARMMSWDYRASADMILRYIDSKILPGYPAVYNERIGGYAFFVYEGSKGVIGDLYADGSIPIAAANIEHRLTTHVIDTLPRSPAVHRIAPPLLLHHSR